MSAERIGKLERWILIHAYKKTVLHEFPINWKVSKNWIKYCEIHQTNIRLSEKAKAEGTHDWYEGNIRRHERCVERMEKFLTKTEVLINYFSLVSKHWSYMKWQDYEDTFPTTKEYRSALVSYSRTLRNMESKGLIKAEYQDIMLTESGKEKAKALMLTLSDAAHNISNKK